MLKTDFGLKFTPNAVMTRREVESEFVKPSNLF